MLSSRDKFGTMNQAKIQKSTGKLLRAWLGDKCPICKESLENHFYARPGIVVAESEAATRFVSAFRQHSWGDIRIKEFNLSLDAILGNILRCPTGRLAWFLTFEPYDPFVNAYYVAELDVLDQHESERLGATIQPTEWRDFPAGWLLSKRYLALKFLKNRKRLILFL